jgi:IclR family acetate operon transcriptional repressor
VGKAMLATFPDEHVREVVDRLDLTRHTAHTLTDPDELVAQVQLVRGRGYAIDEGEQEVGVRCVAVSVPGPAEHLALSVSGPAPRMTDEALAHAVPVLQRAARRLGAANAG